MSSLNKDYENETPLFHQKACCKKHNLLDLTPVRALVCGHPRQKEPA